MKRAMLLVLCAAMCSLLTGCGTYYRLEGKTAAEWAEGLESDDWNVRMEAVTKLGAMAEDDSSAVEHLATALDDAMADVRLAAVRVLKQIGDKAAPIKEKIAQVAKNDKEAHIRKEAQELLTELGG